MQNLIWIFVKVAMKADCSRFSASNEDDSKVVIVVALSSCDIAVWFGKETSKQENLTTSEESTLAVMNEWSKKDILTDGHSSCHKNNWINVKGTILSPDYIIVSHLIRCCMNSTTNAQYNLLHARKYIFSHYL